MSVFNFILIMLCQMYQHLETSFQVDVEILKINSANQETGFSPVI